MDITFRVKPGMTMAIPVAPEELLFLQKFVRNGAISCKTNESETFTPEFLEKRNGLMKLFIKKSRGAVDVYYHLTDLGRKLVQELQSQPEEIPT